MEDFTYISLFSGIGGFEVAFDRAGMKCLAVCEKDKAAQGNLSRTFPHIPIFDDVSQIGKVSHEPETIDLICGGFPCQDVSIAGRRKGLAGERSGLWFEFARIIDELKPRWVVIENVPGLLSSNAGKDFAVILGGLTRVVPSIPVGGWKNSGIAWGRRYGVAWRVLDAQFFGVPQRRRRVFIVASLGNGSAAEVLFESEGGARNNQKGGEAGKADSETFVINLANGGANQNNVKESGIADTIDTWATQAVAFGWNKSSSQTMKVADTTDALQASPTSNPAVYVMAHGQANAEIVKDGEPSLTANHEAPILLVSDFAQITSKEHGSKPSEISQPLNTLGQMTVRHNHQQDGSIRIQEDGTAPTVSRQWGTGGNNVPFFGVRRLMPIECERLQGFPDNFTAGQSDSARYKQLGNAVAIPPVDWIGKRIAAVENKNKKES